MSRRKNFIFGPATGWNRSWSKRYQATPIRLGQGATGRAAATSAPVQIPDILQEQEFADHEGCALCYAGLAIGLFSRCRFFASSKSWEP